MPSPATCSGVSRKNGTRSGCTPFHKSSISFQRRPAMAQQFRRGQIVPQSGVYRITHDPLHPDMPARGHGDQRPALSNLPALQGRQLRARPCRQTCRRNRPSRRGTCAGFIDNARPSPRHGGPAPPRRVYHNGSGRKLTELVDASTGPINIRRSPRTWRCSGARQAYLDCELCGVFPDGMIQAASDAGNAAGLVSSSSTFCVSRATMPARCR